MGKEVLELVYESRGTTSCMPVLTATSWGCDLHTTQPVIIYTTQPVIIYTTQPVIIYTTKPVIIYRLILHSHLFLITV